MPKVTFRFATENEAVFYRTMKQQERQLQAVNQKLAKVGSTGKSSFRGLNSEMKSVVSSLIGPVGLAGAIGAVVMELRKAYQEFRERNRETLNLNQSLGESRATALLNLPASFDGGSVAMDAMVERVAEKSKLERRDVYQAMGPGLSAKGAAGMKAFEDALTLAAKVQKKTGDKYNAGEMVGSLLDIRKATGNEEAMTNFGWLKQVGAGARIESLEGQLRLVPGVAAASARGITPENAMEIQATMSKIIMDKTGERTQTAFVNFTKDLYTKDLLPSVKKTAKGRKTEWGGLSGGIYERIGQLQKAYSEGNLKTRNDIENKLGGRATMSAFTISMLKNTKMYKEELSAAKKEIGMPDKKSAKHGEIFFSDAVKSSPGSLADIEQKKSALIEKQKLQPVRTQGAYTESALDLYERTMKEQGASWTGRNMSSIGMQAESMIKGKPLEEIILEAFKDAQKEIQGINKNYRSIPGGGIVEDKSIEAKAFERTPELLQKAVELLIQIRDDRKKNIPNPNRQEL
jgi:hypothetical protein